MCSAIDEFLLDLQFTEASNATPSNPSLDNLQKSMLRLINIDSMIFDSYKELKEIYQHRFPELETIVSNPKEYSLLVQGLGNNLSNSQKIQELLDKTVSKQLANRITIASSLTIGTKLSQERLNEMEMICGKISVLVHDRDTLMEGIQSLVTTELPATCKLLGADITADLTVYAGSIRELSTMPANHLFLLGNTIYGQRNIIASNDSGQFNKKANNGYGIMYYHPLVQSQPQQHRAKTIRMLAGKAALALKWDLYGVDKSYDFGSELLQMIHAKADSLNLPSAPRHKKPLAIPMEKKSTHRGGRRKREFKEKYRLTADQIRRNRMQLNGSNADEYSEDEGS